MRENFLINNDNGSVRLLHNGNLIVSVRGSRYSRKYNNRHKRLIEQINGNMFTSKLISELEKCNFHIYDGFMEGIKSSINSGKVYIRLIDVIKNKPSVRLLLEYIIESNDFGVDILNTEAFKIGKDIYVTIDVGFDNDVHVMNIFTKEIKYMNLSDLDIYDKFIITEEYIKKNFILK